VFVQVLDPRDTPAVYSPAPPEAPRESDGVLARIKEIVERSATDPVEQVFEIGVPAQVLVNRARGARVLVLGHGARHRTPTGQGYRHGPVLGAIARACVARADCPVVVVPEPVVGSVAKAVEEPAHRAPIQGARALYPFQGRIPVAHG
jgi:nucleotide-binding universal stress UspA family protein